MFQGSVPADVNDMILCTSGRPLMYDESFLNKAFGGRYPDSQGPAPDRYSASRPDYGSFGPDNYGLSRPDYGQYQSNYGQSRPERGESRPDYGQSRPDYGGAARPNFGTSRPDYGRPDSSPAQRPFIDNGPPVIPSYSDSKGR